MKSVLRGLVSTGFAQAVPVSFSRKAWPTNGFGGLGCLTWGLHLLVTNVTFDPYHGLPHSGLSQ